MKKALLIRFLILLFSLSIYSQSVRIISIVEENCLTDTAAPGLIELFIESTVDLANLITQFEFTTN